MKFYCKVLISLIVAVLLEIFCFNFRPLLVILGVNTAIEDAVKFDISISRIVAVVAIYVIGSLLFRIQKMPDYFITSSKDD